jgi:flagellar basal-body rod protein FlgF
MADGIYIAMNGAAARSEQLDSVADNLANAQTPGFKASRPVFQTFLPAGGSPDKAYPAAVGQGVSLKEGSTQLTHNPMDIVPGDGNFLAVRTASGELAFTRDGRLTVNPQGELLAAGRPVMGKSGEPITFPPNTQPRVDDQGRVWADDVEMDSLALYEVTGATTRIGSSLLQPTSQGRAVASDSSKVRVGELEMGNVTALESSVELISAQRHYETSLQAIQTYRRMDDRANEIGKVR